MMKTCSITKNLLDDLFFFFSPPLLQLYLFIFTILILSSIERLWIKTLACVYVYK